jgi:hypothetical protein
MRFRLCGQGQISIQRYLQIEECELRIPAMQMCTDIEYAFFGAQKKLTQNQKKKAKKKEKKQKAAEKINGVEEGTNQ